MAETPHTPFVSTDPEHIAISKSKGIKIDWKDGHTSEYGLRYLRHHCPCAVCSGSHGTPPQAPPIEPSPFDVRAAPEDGERRAGGQLRHPHCLERWPRQ